MFQNVKEPRSDYVLLLDMDSSKVIHFCRDLVAFCTGVVGEGSASNSWSDLFYRDFDISDDEEENGKMAFMKSIFHGFIGFIQDERGEYRHFCLWSNPNWGYDHEGVVGKKGDLHKFPAEFSIGIFFNLLPLQDHIAVVESRARQFLLENYPEVNLEGIRLLRRDVTFLELVI